MYQGMHDRSDLGIVFVQGEDQSGPAEVTELEDGNVVVDLRHRIRVPVGDISEWVEQTCEPSFQALAQTSSSKSYPLLTPGFAAIELTPDEFFDWCKTRGFEKPGFWRFPVMPSSPEKRSPVTSSLEKPKRGRPPEYNWSGVRERLTEYTSTNGPVKNLEELLEKCGDFASELHPKNDRPDDSTIRAAIEKHGLNTAAGLAPGK